MSVGTASAVDAAYLNASYGHGFEYDDFFGNAHPGCAVVPAAFAIGEELDANRSKRRSPRWSSATRSMCASASWGSPAVLNVGWQPHAIFGNFGAAAIAAKMHGLDEEQTFHALAIALSHASGPTEYASTGGSIKRIHAGHRRAQRHRVGRARPRRHHRAAHAS